MTRQMRQVVLAAAVAACAWASQPRAARADRQWELGGFLGGHFFSDTNKLGRFHDGDLFYTTQGLAKQDTQLALNHQALFGLRLAYHFIPRLGLEGELALIPTTTRGGADWASQSVPVLAYRAHLVFQILTGRVRPFLLAGGGAMTALPSNPGALPQGTDTDPQLHAGVGVKVDIDKDRHWGLRLDGRVQFPPDTTKKLATQDFEVTLGVYGLFPFTPTPDPPKPAEPAPAEPAPAEPAPAAK